jgi:SET domain-containing protein
MQRIPSLYVGPSPLHGKGVFTYEPIAQGSLLEICPALVMPKEAIPLLDQTLLYDYYFQWGEKQEKCALVLGFGSLYNHSFDPNAEYDMDYENETLDIYALRDIAAGEEILFNYFGYANARGELWFEQPKS